MSQNTRGRGKTIKDFRKESRPHIKNQESECQEDRRKWSGAFKILRENDYQPKILSYMLRVKVK